VSERATRDEVASRPALLVFAGLILPFVGAQLLLVYRFRAPVLLALVFAELFLFLWPAALLLRASNLRPLEFLGLSRAPALPLALGALVGAANFPIAGLMVELILRVSPQKWVLQYEQTLRVIQVEEPLARAAAVLAVVIAAPLGEETLFRGYLLRVLGARWGLRAGLALTAALFAAIHLAPATLLPLAWLGLLFGWLSWRSGSLWPAVAAHAMQNGISTVLAWTLDEKADRLPLDLTFMLAGAGAVVLGAALYAFHAATRAQPGAPDAEKRDAARPVSFDAGALARPAVVWLLAALAAAVAFVYAGRMPIWR
jgi:hypothetical protein